MPDEIDVTLEDDAPVIEVQIIGTGPVGPTGGPGPAGPEGPAGSDGVSPEVTITAIPGGHRVTITDAEHPSGQSFDVMDGGGGGGAVDSVNGQTGAVELDAEDVGALPEDTLIPEAYNFNVTSQHNMGWAADHFIGTSDGAWKTNSSYPYDYGAQGFLAVSNQSPVAVTMGDDSMQFRAFFYASNSANAYLGCTSFFGGGKTIVFNGKYNNYAYSYVRFVVQMADHSYSTAIYNSLVAAFTLLSSTDSSLSVKRAAADAKAIGDALAAKIPAPSSPATGAFLVYNGSAWVAQTLSTWQGGSY